MSILIISACSAKKDDSIPIHSETSLINPKDYVNNNKLLQHFLKTRETVFKLPKINLGNKVTCAFDLYTLTGFTYRHLRKNNLQKIRTLLDRNSEIQWFFLSGGYGILNALEPARNYQATFNRTIHYQSKDKIPFTGTIWKRVLPQVCNEIFIDKQPEWLFVFGSQDYTNFVKSTDYWNRMSNIKMFESTGSAGIHWLSPKISELVDIILENRLDRFISKYNKFNKQRVD